MKICQINVVYGVGSTGKIVRDVHSSLQKMGEVSTVITPQKSPFTSESGVHVVSYKWLSYASAIFRRGLGMQYDWATIQTCRIIRHLKRIKPDIVHLHCINGNDINIYMLLSYLAKHHIKTIYTLHAEFPYTGGCGHAYDCERWKNGCGRCPILKEATQSPIIDGTHRTWMKLHTTYQKFNKSELLFTAVSPWLKNRAEDAPLLKGIKKEVVMNGVDVSVFHCNNNNTWHEKLNIQADTKVILHVTASFYPHQQNLKGGKYILELANKLSDENVVFVVAANRGDDSNLPFNVFYVGRTNSQKDLAELYSEANLTIVTSSRETFSMPVAESLCCGTPVVGFKAGGPESIAIKNYSEFVDYGDVESLKKVVKKFLATDYNQIDISKLAQQMYSKEVMTSNYIKLYQSMLGK